VEIKKKTLKKAVLVIFLFMIGIIVFKNQPNPEIYSITGSVIAYSEERNTPNYQQVFSHTENAIDIFSVVYSTRPLLDQPLSIHGLLFIPQGKKNIPGVVYLPAGGGTKEGRSPLAKRIAAEGYAVLVIDQRGIGDTGGRYLSFEDDHQLFSQGEEPVQHLSVYDALAATDVLRDIKEINQNQIVMIGESMGGRYALIATALDIRIRGVIGISTAGFHIPNNPDDPGNNFMRSIDADQYIRRISPIMTI